MDHIYRVHTNFAYSSLHTFGQCFKAVTSVPKKTLYTFKLATLLINQLKNLLICIKFYGEDFYETTKIHRRYILLPAQRFFAYSISFFVGYPVPFWENIQNGILF